MSQPRRRRRRGRRGGRGGQPQAQGKKDVVRETASGSAVEEGQPRSKSTRRRRGRGRSGGGRRSSPKSSEDLVRALPKERPETLTAPPDGQTLEGVIGDLQSTWGVPQYPQEYRIVLKVAEEKESRGDQTNGQGQQRGNRSAPREQAPEEGAEQQPRRERAPAAPGVGSSGQREKAPRKRRRRRKRGGQGPRPEGGSNGGGGASGGGAEPEGSS